MYQAIDPFIVIAKKLIFEHMIVQVYEGVFGQAKRKCLGTLSITTDANLDWVFAKKPTLYTADV